MSATSERRPRTMLVAGGHGVTGRAIVDVAAARPGWRVLTLGRRSSVEGSAGHLAVDLLDPHGTRETLRGLSEADAVAFCAYLPAEEGPDDPNIAMLANMLAALEDRPLDRFVLMGGGKSYGPHLGRYRTPARESDPRVMGPIFYDRQQDLVEAWSLKTGVPWTILRPDLVFGPSLGSPMNMVTSLAAFALISRELGLPLRFPGSHKAWNALVQATDAGLLGRAALWAVDAPGAANAVFNIINGDQFRWRHLWADLADVFGMPVDEPQPLPLARQMADKGPVWDAIVARYGLAPVPLDRLASWGFLDVLLNVPFDMVQSTIKIRRAGFGDCIDTRDSLRTQLGRLRDMRVIA